MVWNVPKNKNSSSNSYAFPRNKVVLKLAIFENLEN